MKFLQGEKVYLRPINLDDTEVYLQMLLHPETRKFTGLQKSFTRESIRQYIESKNLDDSSILFLIGVQETNHIIGDIQLLQIDTINRNCYIRISIENRANQGKGYGTEAMKLMLDYAFGVLNLHRVELNVFSYNEKAIHHRKKE